MDNTTKILQDIAAGIITPEEGQKLLKQTKEKTKGISLKVGPKGAIGIYGLRSRPISLYYTELTAIMDHMLTTEWAFNEEMDEFLRENDDKMSMGKGDKKAKKTQPKKAVSVKKRKEDKEDKEETEEVDNEEAN